MKIQRVLTISLAIVLVVVVVLSSTVFAAPIQQMLNVFVNNGPDNPVPVEVQDATPVNVEVADTDPVDVEGNVDVSGWKHTTESGVFEKTVNPGGHGHYVGEIITTGYRQITFILQSSGAPAIFDFSGQTLNAYYQYDLDLQTSGDGGYTLVQTIDIVGEKIQVYAQPAGDAAVDIAVTYYLTT